jgi:hypothetical protein
MKIRNISTEEQRIHFEGKGITLAVSSDIDLPSYAALDLAASFPTRFLIIDETPAPVPVAIHKEP